MSQRRQEIEPGCPARRHAQRSNRAPFLRIHTPFGPAFSGQRRARRRASSVRALAMWRPNGCAPSRSPARWTTNGQPTRSTSFSTPRYGATLQYSLLYMNAFVHEVPPFFRNLIPTVEAVFATPVSNIGPSSPGAIIGTHETLGTVQPGVFYIGRLGPLSFELGAEALIPINHASGRHVGAAAFGTTGCWQETCVPMKAGASVCPTTRPPSSGSKGSDGLFGDPPLEKCLERRAKRPSIWEPRLNTLHAKPLGTPNVS
jgi:hypothetical protein